jgi:hypothetical protein
MKASFDEDVIGFLFQHGKQHRCVCFGVCGCVFRECVCLCEYACVVCV